MPSIEEFGKKLKEKYPQYNNIDDRELGLKMLEKHPEYKDRVFDTDPNTQAQIVGQPEATQGVMGAIKKGFSNIKEGIQKSGQELSQTLDSNAPTPLKVAKTATGLIKSVVSPLAEAAVATPARIAGEVAENVTGIDVNEAVAQGTQRLVQKGLDTEAAKKAMEGWSQLKETNPDAAMALSTVLDIGDIASNVVGIKGAKMAGEVGLKGAAKTAKVAGKATGKAVDAVGEAGKYAVGQTFGLNKETIKNIIDNPNLFTQKEIAKIDRESIFTKAKTALESRMEALSETGKEYNKIRQIPVKTSVSEKTILGKLAEKGIDVKDGKISVNLGSEIQLSKADISGLEEVLGLLQGKDGLTPTEILNLRKRLSNLSGFAEGRTDASSKVAKEIRATIDQIAKKEIPGLSEIDARFSSERQFLDKVKGVMFDRKGNIKDNAISKIATLTGKGKEMMLERMEKVIPGITEDLNILKAIEDIDYAKGQKVGAYGRTGMSLMTGSGLGAVAGGPFGAILGVIATSPQVGVSLIRSYGKAKGMAKDAVESVIGKMKSGKKLLDTEKKIIDEAVNEAAKKAGSRLKDMGSKGGLSLQDVTKQPGYDPLLQEAGSGKYKSAEEFVNSKINVYHGTGRPISQFEDIGGIGTHLGTSKETAVKRLIDTGVTDGKVIEANVDIKKPLRARDYRFWNDAKTVAKGLQKDGIFNTKDVQEILSGEVMGRKPFPAIKEKLRQLGYDGIVYKNSIEGKGTDSIIAFSPDQIKTKSQLTDIYNLAKKPASDPLLQEAGNGVEDALVKEIRTGKYKSAEEFRKAVSQSHLMDLSNPEKHNIGRAFAHYKDEPLTDISDVLRDKDRPGSYLSTMKYSNPVEYRAISSPGETIKIYRAVPENVGDEIRIGDYVALDKKYAQMHLDSVLEGEQATKGKIISMEVPKKDIIWGEADFTEWAYSPRELRDKYPTLDDIYNKAQGTNKKYIQGEGGKMKGSKPGMSENVGIVKEGKKIKEKILNEMADFTEYAADQKRGKKIEYVVDEIRARKIAEQLGINPDVSNWQLSKRFGTILKKYNYIR